MPPLGNIADTRGEAHWGGDVHVEVVEAAWGPKHLCEQASI